MLMNAGNSTAEISIGTNMYITSQDGSYIDPYSNSTGIGWSKLKAF